MRSQYQFRVPEGNTFAIPKRRIIALQEQLVILGAASYPNLMRLGTIHVIHMQPVTAGVLLREVEEFATGAQQVTVAGISFLNKTDDELGTLYSHLDQPADAAPTLRITADGILVTVRQFPPPIGFRSSPSTASGSYTCLFDALRRNSDGWLGFRAKQMGGSGAPVQLPSIPLPPTTQWDYASATGAAEVATITLIQTPAIVAFRDVLHTIQTSCNDSLRLHQPLHICTL